MAPCVPREASAIAHRVRSRNDSLVTLCAVRIEARQPPSERSTSPLPWRCNSFQIGWVAHWEELSRNLFERTPRDCVHGRCVCRGAPGPFWSMESEQDADVWMGVCAAHWEQGAQPSALSQVPALSSHYSLASLVLPSSQACYFWGFL